MDSTESSYSLPTVCHQYSSRLRKSKILSLLNVTLEAEGTSILVITHGGMPHLFTPSSQSLPRLLSSFSYSGEKVQSHFHIQLALTLPLSIPTAPALIHIIVMSPHITVAS